MATFLYQTLTYVSPRLLNVFNVLFYFLIFNVYCIYDLKLTVNDESPSISSASATAVYVPLGAGHIFAAPYVIEYFIGLYRAGIQLWRRPELN